MLFLVKVYCRVSFHSMTSEHKVGLEVEILSISRQPLIRRHLYLNHRFCFHSMTSDSRVRAWGKGSKSSSHLKLGIILYAS